MIFKKDSHWRDGWLGVLGRTGLLLLVFFLLLMLSSFRFFSGEFSGIRPFFMLMAVYYWAVTRPVAIPYVAIFFVGLTLDLVADYPMGLNAATLIAVQWIAASQRRFLLGQSFAVIWAGFGVISLGVALLQWLVFMAFYGSFMGVKAILMSAVLTAAIFPLVAPLLATINKMLAGDAQEE